VREQIEEGVTGYVVPPAMPGPMAEAMIRTSRDLAWRERAARRAQEIVTSRFTVDSASAGLAAVLREVA
jgi:glycosyltransferase involved in cell wall biosynthesis